MVRLAGGPSDAGFSSFAQLRSLTLIFIALHDRVHVFGRAILFRDALTIFIKLMPIVRVFEIGLQLANWIILVQFQNLVNLLIYIALAFDSFNSRVSLARQYSSGLEDSESTLFVLNLSLGDVFLDERDFLFDALVFLLNLLYRDVVIE